MSPASNSLPPAVDREHVRRQDGERSEALLNARGRYLHAAKPALFGGDRDLTKEESQFGLRGSLISVGIRFVLCP